jgi:hypothetical protein
MHKCKPDPQAPSRLKIPLLSFTGKCFLSAD